MDKRIEEIIEKKKNEIIEQVRKDTEGLEQSIVDNAVFAIEKFTEDLKIAASMSIADDLLSIIEKDGIVWRGEINTKKNWGWEYMGKGNFLRSFGEHLSNQFRDRGKLKTSNLRVTLIVEPLGGVK